MPSTDRISLTPKGRALAAQSPKLRGYAEAIAKATGATDPTTLEKIENAMRHDIFHSTLDWQDARTFNKGAREAYGLVRIMERPKVDTVLPEDAETARLLGIGISDVANLVKEPA